MTYMYRILHLNPASPVGSRLWGCWTVPLCMKMIGCVNKWVVRCLSLAQKHIRI
jgi:hypothetical protein